MIGSAHNLRSIFKQIGIALCVLLVSGTVVCAETIEIVTEDLPPLQFVQNGAVTGPATEIVTTAMKDAGLAYTIQAYPWSRAYQIALHRQNVCIFSIVKLKERIPHFRWAGSNASSKNGAP